MPLFKGLLGVRLLPLALPPAAMLGCSEAYPDAGTTILDFTASRGARYNSILDQSLYGILLQTTAQNSLRQTQKGRFKGDEGQGDREQAAAGRGSRG